MAYVTSLTSSDLDYGKLVAEQLKANRFPYAGLFWYYDEPKDDWQLMVATELVDKVGPRETYAKLGKSISNLPSSDFQRLRLTAISPLTPIYQALRSVFGEAKSVEGARLRHTVVNNLVVPEAYLYEIR